MSGLVFPNWLSGLPLYTRVLGFLRTGRLAASMLVQEAKAAGEGASVGWFFAFAVKLDILLFLATLKTHLKVKLPFLGRVKRLLEVLGQSS